MRWHANVIFTTRDMVEIYAIPQHSIRYGLAVDVSNKAIIDYFFGGLILGQIKVILGEILWSAELIRDVGFDLVRDTASIGVVLHRYSVRARRLRW